MGRQHSARILLQPGQWGGTDEFDAEPDIPVDQLDWLVEPPEGWPTWEPLPDEASGGEDSVVTAVTGYPSETPSKSTEAAQASHI